MKKRLILVCTTYKCATGGIKSLKTVHICKKAKYMITLLASYAVFWDLLDRERIYRDENLDFPTVCDFIGIACDRLDSLLLEETGFHGQDILAHFRGIGFSMEND